MNARATPHPEAPALDSYYARHVKVHPREVEGRFNRLRRLAVFALLGLYYAGPWLRWNGHQALLFDLPGRKFWIFGLVLWPQDFIYLTWLLVLLGLSLFFFTAIAGRLWCGYACPQTVWTEVFVWIERYTEGNRHQRIKLDAAPWTAAKLARKGAKQCLWVALSLWTGLTFTGFFVPIATLAPALATLTLGGWPLFWTLFYGAATYGNAGYLREQVCKYMCPYARFQSAMFDRDTLIISYDLARGEPRSRLGRRAGQAGDCIDCTLCVQACPTGIDIRDGLQYECIACAACIDACDAVMQRIGLAPGLVRYSSQQALEGRPARLLRPRILVYAGLLTAIFSAGAAGLALRSTVGVDVIRDRNALYRDTGRGEIENVYNLRILNKDPVPHRFRVAVAGIEGLHVGEVRSEWPVAGGEVYLLPLRVAVAAGAVHGGRTIRFTLTAADDPSRHVTETARFFAP